MIKCMHKINDFHLRFDIWYNLFQTCYYTLVNCCQVHAYIASNGGENKKKKKQLKKVVNQFLLLVTYHIILSIEMSFSLFILLVLIHYILGWVGCFF